MCCLFRFPAILQENQSLNLCKSCLLLSECVKCLGIQGTLELLDAIDATITSTLSHFHLRTSQNLPISKATTLVFTSNLQCSYTYQVICYLNANETKWHKLLRYSIVNWHIRNICKFKFASFNREMLQNVKNCPVCGHGLDLNPVHGSYLCSTLVLTFFHISHSTIPVHTELQQPLSAASSL